MDPETHSIILPDVFAKVLSSDATFETSSSNLAKNLLLRRKDNLIGPKRLIYTIDKAKTNLAATRKVFTKFFKEVIGFEEKEIIFVDRSKFGKDA